MLDDGLGELFEVEGPAGRGWIGHIGLVNRTGSRPPPKKAGGRDAVYPRLAAMEYEATVARRLSGWVARYNAGELRFGEAVALDPPIAR